LESALYELGHLETEIEALYRRSQLTDALAGLRNQVQVARLIASAALENKYSQGCHYRLPEEETGPLFRWLLQQGETVVVGS
jgi:L-aspartate oxidase